MRAFATFLLLLVSTTAPSPAQAHEYYLLPDDFSPKVGQTVAVRHLLGQRFNGGEMPWINAWNIRSEVWIGGGQAPLRSSDGSLPALKLTPGNPELHIVVHESNISRLKFRTWEKFESYARKSGLQTILDRHLAEKRPMPSEEKPLIELYARFAKTLLTVAGDTRAVDAQTGLRIELVAKANPLSLSAGAAMPVQLIYEGKPLAGATVHVFNRIDSEIAHSLVTDRDGMAQIPDDGTGPYLLNAIHMIDATKDSKGDPAHYQSFWASLTYKRGP